MTSSSIVIYYPRRLCCIVLCIFVCMLHRTLLFYCCRLQWQTPGMIYYQIIIMSVILNESKGTILTYGLIGGIGALVSLVRVVFAFLRRRLVRLLSWSVAVIYAKSKSQICFSHQFYSRANRKSENTFSAKLNKIKSRHQTSQTAMSYHAIRGEATILLLG